MTDARLPLDRLEQPDGFIRHHIGPGEAEIAEMLEAIGLPSLEALVAEAVPESIRTEEPLPLAPAMGEREALAKLAAMAEKNQVKTSLIGMGYYDCFTPPVIQRNVLENPGWYTAYTPYQAEISQGRLEALLNYQQMVMDLTGMDLANASLLDEGTAAAEAMTMLRRVGKSKSNRFLVDRACHPQTIAILETRAAPLDIELVVADVFAMDESDFFGVLVQYPDTYGEVRDPKALIDWAHEAGALVAVASDLLALTLLTPPGELGADVVLGNSQRFGVPMGYGGPHAAFFATREAYKRSVPGRIIGVSIDRHGKTSLRMALQTREQHIRREKATSNICTAQVLLAVMAGFYAVYHGPEGLKTIARRVHRLTGILAKGLEDLGFERANQNFFDTLTIEAGEKAEAIVTLAAEAGINLRATEKGRIGIALDETTDRAVVAAVLDAFAGKASGLEVAMLDEAAVEGLPETLARKSDFLTHPNFNSFRSETEMLRYLRRLEAKDIALNRAMIPLGSCTMKLNATAEMMPITWPNFAGLHPFCPPEQATGFHEMIASLEDMLAKATGFAAVSIQPNAGSQGEYAGLLTIRAYHKSRGEAHRDVVLIPSSAHGTNPASAVMAGCRVKIVGCDENGNVDLEDLKAKAAQHSDELAGLMITYPSTHGVFEAEIREICKTIHDHGGQVYMDGANLNALVGTALPGEFGADVAHMNLHKTFCIPHGGGGPGVGPIGVAAHLKPFLPGHPLRESVGGEQAIGPISAAPYGSALILVISWMYIAMMGAKGLKKATEVAILNANYIAKQLSPHYPVLYTGKNGRVAHECILDTRVLERDYGITVDDIAKRLIDFGFHAPTMSFPVAGTLMVEPTESEAKGELDRFIDAMVKIREEAEKVGRGDWPKEDNPLVNAPHPLAEVATGEWTHPYSREEAAFTASWLLEDKYWPPVARVDNVYGDRHLICSCPSPEAYRDAAE